MNGEFYQQEVQMQPEDDKILGVFQDVATTTTPAAVAGYL